MIKVKAFLDINYNKSMLDIPQVGSSIGIDTYNKKGINKNRTNNWQSGGLNKTEIFICQKINSGTMKALSYKPELINPNYLLLLYYYLSFPLKLIVSFMLNLKRMKNIKKSVKRRLFNN